MVPSRRWNVEVDYDTRKRERDGLEQYRAGRWIHVSRYETRYSAAHWSKDLSRSERHDCTDDVRSQKELTMLVER